MNSTQNPEPELIEVAEATTAVIAEVVPMADISGFFDRAFTTLPDLLEAQGVAILGPGFGLYHGPPTDTADLEVGFATDRAVEAQGPVRPGTLPGGRAARLVHHGGLDQLGAAWGRLQSWIGEHDLEPGAILWEVYVTEPTPDMDPADLRTELNWLLA